MANSTTATVIEFSPEARGLFSKWTGEGASKKLAGREVDNTFGYPPGTTEKECSLPTKIHLKRKSCIHSFLPKSAGWMSEWENKRD